MYYDSLKRRVRAEAERKRQKKEAAALIDNLDIKAHIAPIYHSLHNDIQRDKYEFYNLPGGRGSGKSSFISLEIVKGIMDDKTGEANAIVFRYVGATMRESVYSQIAWALDALGVNHLWRGTICPMCWTYIPTGAVIVFRGLDDAAKLKSIKPRRGYFRYIWLEEFSELPGENFSRSVMQSVQRGGDKFTVFRSFNPPISLNNWANKFVELPNDKAVTFKTDYTMIPREWLGESFIYEAERLKEVNPRAYEHEYLGKPTGTGGEVFPALSIRTITDEEINDFGYVYHGIDFGFAADPACYMRVAYDQKHDTIYLLDEIYKRGLSNKQLAEEIKAKKYHVENMVAFCGEVYADYYWMICDAAEPKSIQDLRSCGLKCRACHKEPGCVEYRIKWLQNRQIVIDPARTPNAYKEFVNYEYATSKDGEILSQLVDKDNHSIDAVAYALNDLIYYNKRHSGLSA